MLPYFSEKDNPVSFEYSRIKLKKVNQSFVFLKRNVAFTKNGFPSLKKRVISLVIIFVLGEIREIQSKQKFS
jgi:hypothetical protein